MSQELMTRTCAGDLAAFEALVELYWPEAERVARGIVRDAQLAQDVAQEVFADLYVQRERYRATGSVGGFVAAIARHKSLDLMRRRGRTLPEGVVAEGSTPEDVLVAEMFRGALYGALEALPVVQQRVVKAYALEGKAYREIAGELGISLGQVKIALHRARKVLRKVRDHWMD